MRYSKIISLTLITIQLVNVSCLAKSSKKNKSAISIASEKNQKQSASSQGLNDVQYGVKMHITNGGNEYIVNSVSNGPELAEDLSSSNVLAIKFERSNQSENNVTNQPPINFALPLETQNPFTSSPTFPINSDELVMIENNTPYKGINALPILSTENGICVHGRSIFQVEFQELTSDTESEEPKISALAATIHQTCADAREKDIKVTAEIRYNSAIPFTLEVGQTPTWPLEDFTEEPPVTYTYPVLGQEINGHSIGSFEPCVYHKDNASSDWYDMCFFNIDSKSDNGFAPSQEAKDCALESNKRLVGWLSVKNSPVEKAITILEAKYGRKSIYTIISDFKNAGDRYRAFSAKLWTYQMENGQPGTGRYFKYNIAINQEGVCSIPTESQIVETVKKWVGEDYYNNYQQQN